MNIKPEGEELRKAVKWISEMRQDQPGQSLGKLIEEAGFKFNLSPNEAQYLTRLLKTESDAKNNSI